MKKSIVSIAVGSAFVAGAALAPAVHAADNPFSGAKLESGYQLAQADTKAKDGKCGEGKCGAERKKHDGKCAGDKKHEAKCGGDKAKDGKCGANKQSEARCGANKAADGKCGADKK